MNYFINFFIFPTIDPFEFELDLYCNNKSFVKFITQFDVYGFITLSCLLGYPWKLTTKVSPSCYLIKLLYNARI